jgi:uncharacterized protein YukE
MDRDGVQGLVYRCAEHLAVLAEQTDRVDRLVATTGEGWTGQAADTWRQNATDLATRIRDLDPALRSGAQALDDYAMTVASIAARAQIVSADLDAARAGAARARADLTRLRSGTDADEGDLRHARYLVSAREDEQDNATLLLARLAEERRCADQILTARLRAAVPAAWADSGGLAGTLDPGVFRGEAIDLSAVGLWALALEAGARGDAALRWLAGQLTGADLDALLARCPDLATRLVREDRAALARTHPDLAAALAVGEPDARIAAVAAAFATMTPAQAARAARMFPGLVGNLDGAPLAVRAAANRIVIRAAIPDAERRIAAMDARIAELEALRATGSRRWDDDLLRCRIERQELVERIPWCEGLLAEPVGAINYRPDHPPAWHQVVLFDPDAGRFGEVIGPLDAENLAVLVGGTGTNLTTMDDQAQRAWKFVATDPGALAVITYLGGPMPQNAIVNSPLRTYADAIGPHLAGFANGIRATIEVPLTVAGHSYGGLVVGQAEATGMVVDRVIYVEASGSGVRDAHEYAAPDTPRYSMTAPGDFIEPVQASGAHGSDPDEITGTIRLETGRFHPETPADGPERLVSGWSSHSEVFDPETDAFTNIHAVMTGGEVKLWTPPTDRWVQHTGVLPTRERHYPTDDPTFVPPTQDVP